MPKTYTKAGNWDHTMRRLIRQEHGSGWTVMERHGKTRLTRTYEDKTRAYITLDIEWEPNNATAIQNEIGVLKQRMAEHNISLKEAHARSQNVKGVVTGEGVKAGAVDWQAVANAFLDNPQRAPFNNNARHPITNQQGNLTVQLTAQADRRS